MQCRCHLHTKTLLAQSYRRCRRRCLWLPPLLLLPLPLPAACLRLLYLRPLRMQQALRRPPRSSKHGKWAGAAMQPSQPAAPFTRART